jgi:hypothetical protein
MAELMAAIVSDDYAFEEIDWDDPNVDACLKTFSKTSLLGHFCFRHIALHESRRFRKNSDLMEIEDEYFGFERYAIPFMRFEEWRRDSPQTQTADDRDDFYPWMHHQEEAFEQLWERMTDEVVHLLFGNRGFLLEFNGKLAKYRKTRGDTQSRRRVIPQWVRKAVYFRENGKCALCKKDLSHLTAIDAKQHYDHIVPLKKLGINDPCNIQLLCEQCNLQKGSSPGRTSFVYQPWWE